MPFDSLFSRLLDLLKRLCLQGCQTSEFRLSAAMSTVKASTGGQAYTHGDNSNGNGNARHPRGHGPDGTTPGHLESPLKGRVSFRWTPSFGRRLAVVARCCRPNARVEQARSA